MNKLSFINELGNLRPNSTFLALHGYRDSHNGVADYKIIFNISYKNALLKSVSILEEYTATDDLEKRAKKDLIESYKNSLKKIQDVSIEDVDDAYQRFFTDNNSLIKGVKLHTDTGQLHIFGSVVNKRVIIPGTYPTKNKRPLTVAKDKLRKLVPVGKFKQFIINSDRVESISVQNIKLLPPE
jgi:hypothetical protein